VNSTDFFQVGFKADFDVFETRRQKHVKRLPKPPIKVCQNYDGFLFADGL
jgi:hypothetical protein